MRASFLLLIVVAAFLLVLRFYPSADVEGADPLPQPSASLAEPAPAPEQVGAGAGTRFLTRPEGSAGTLYRGAEAPAGGAAGPSSREPAPATAAAADPAELPSWLREIEAKPVRNVRSAEVDLARAVLHGPVADVARELDDPETGLSEERCLVVLAFKEALDGRRSRALEHAQALGERVQWAPGDEERMRLALMPDGAHTARPSAAREEGALELAMEMALARREADELFQERRFDGAARLYSELLLNELDAPWEAQREALERWSAALNAAQDEYRWNPRGDWPSVELVVEEGESLTSIRKRYLERYPARVLCTGLIAKANELRGYLQPGHKLRIPTDTVEVLVDLSTRRALVLLGGEVARSYEIGIGRPGQETITGVFTVGDEKQKEPSWFPAGQEMVPYGDPRNPLGTRWIPWLRDGDRTSYGFHGTNDPASVGLAQSDGCIRLRNPDVEELFEVLPVGARILVRE